MRTFVFCALAFVPLGAGQSRPSTVQTLGACSPVINQNTGTVSIICTGVDPALTEQLRKTATLLDRIVKRKADPDLLRKLDEKIDELLGDTRELRQGVAELRAKAIAASRGVTSTYDFNGARRETSPGKSSVVVAEETAVFQQMLLLQSQRRWEELVDLCESQIGKTPGWLTPYLFSGVAYANLGQTAKAIDRLKYTQDQAGGDPAYDDAARLLRKLGAQ